MTDDGWDVLYPPGVRSRPAGERLRRALLPALVPASWAYQVVSNAVRGARSAAALPGPDGVCVVSVGNLEAGGSGKTPLAVHLIESIAASGASPVYISRGFGGVAARLDAVTVVPAVKSGAAVIREGARLLRRDAAGLAAQIGDEGAMVARRLPGTPLFFCRDKSRALEMAAETLAPTHAVLDDAFQSWGVARDVDIVVVDGDRPFGDGWLLPAGRFREPAEALERADLIGVGGVDGDEQLSRARTMLSAAGIHKPSFGIRRAIEVVAADGRPSGAGGRKCAALSAIGKPLVFERQLRAAGVELIAAFRYPDHHPYSRADVEWIARQAARLGVDAVVTTEKDWAKLSDLGPPIARTLVARLSLELFGGDPMEVIKKAAA